MVKQVRFAETVEIKWETVSIDSETSDAVFQAKHVFRLVGNDSDDDDEDPIQMQFQLQMELLTKSGKKQLETIHQMSLPIFQFGNVYMDKIKQMHLCGPQPTPVVIMSQPPISTPGPKKVISMGDKTKKKTDGKTKRGLRRPKNVPGRDTPEQRKMRFMEEKLSKSIFEKYVDHTRTEAGASQIQEKCYGSTEDTNLLLIPVHPKASVVSVSIMKMQSESSGTEVKAFEPIDFTIDLTTVDSSAMFADDDQDQENQALPKPPMEHDVRDKEPSGKCVSREEREYNAETTKLSETTTRMLLLRQSALRGHNVPGKQEAVVVSQKKAKSIEPPGSTSIRSALSNRVPSARMTNGSTLAEYKVPRHARYLPNKNQADERPSSHHQIPQRERPNLTKGLRLPFRPAPEFVFTTMESE